MAESMPIIGNRVPSKVPGFATQIIDLGTPAGFQDGSRQPGYQLQRGYVKIWRAITALDWEVVDRALDVETAERRIARLAKGMA